ncbi:MAG: glycosyltransferase family 2 protein [Planctomycetes bacterium]|nr:glycosyltransferase family 2 protein [Planctomycetota bacterium]
MPRVSVIIPTYNRSNLVKEAIESVLRQSRTDFEAIVVDDGSTDNTRSLVEQISDSRVKYFYKDNGGHCSARNFGLVKAGGQYIAFLDHDDLWPANYLEVMMDRLQGQIEFGAAYARVMLMSDDGKTKPFARDERYKSGWLTKSFFRAGPCIMPSATLFRKDVLQGFFFDEALRTGEDNDAFMRLSVKTPFLFVSDAHVFRREIPGSISKDLSVDDQCNGILSFERFYYRLGGDKFVPSIVAKRSISHKYRRAAKAVAQSLNRTAAIVFIKRAICYYPFDIRLYFDLLKFSLLSKKNDPKPNWKMPGPLSREISVSVKPIVSQ